MEVPEQQIAGHLNYKGDVRGSFDSMKALGPNTRGEMCWPVSAEYDPETKMTRVAFSKTPPPEWYARMEAMSQRTQTKNKNKKG